MQQLTGDHPAAAASLQRALALFGDLGDLHGQAYALNALGVVQQETGDYPAAAASQRRALALFREIGHRLGRAYALNDLGLVQQQTGDYPAAAAGHQQALALFTDLGNLLGQAEALNRLGELSLRTSATGQAYDQHTRALAIARDIGAAPEEARALDGIGQSHIQDGNLSEGTAHLRLALTIYQRINSPSAERVRKPCGNMRSNQHPRPVANKRISRQAIALGQAERVGPPSPIVNPFARPPGAEQNDHSGATPTTGAADTDASISAAMRAPAPGLVRQPHFTS